MGFKNVFSAKAVLYGDAGIASFPAAVDPADGVSIAEVLRAILTSMVGSDDYDGYTKVGNVANVSLNAVLQGLAKVLGVDNANTLSQSIDGTARTTLEGIAVGLDSYLGARADAAAAGAVTTTDTLIGYVKQLVTLLLEGTYGLSALQTLIDTKAMGRLQIATTTEDLNQAAATYDLLTGTAQAVVLEKLNIKMPTGAAGGSVTSIAIVTDDATAGTIISATDGAVANLTSEADLAWTGALLINVGTKIRLTIAGGAHGSEYLTTIVAQYRAVVNGGYLG